MPLDFLPLPGTLVDELDTPALLIDLPVMERNLKTLHSYFAQRTSKVRPHVKAHKSPILAHRQLDAGATAGGICCAKVGEAEVMVHGGIKDVFIANEIVTRPKIARLMSLARDADMMVAVDNPRNVEELSEAAQSRGVGLRAVVDVNVGLDRCGVEPGPGVVDLAKLVANAPGLRFAGLMGYEGGMWIDDFEERSVETKARVQKLLDSRELVERAGLPVEVVSAGGTGTWNITGEIPGVTEVQAGAYPFMDAHYRYVPEFDVSLMVLATVISRPAKDLAITDCGHKSIGVTLGLPAVAWPEGAEVFKLSAEHGSLKLDGDAQQLALGDKVWLVPSHGGTPVNIHSHYFTVRDGRLEAVLEILARARFT
jgi:D-serine deaminase-like pyridoxal phosphate-dependent protein